MEAASIAGLILLEAVGKSAFICLKGFDEWYDCRRIGKHPTPPTVPIERHPHRHRCGRLGGKARYRRAAAVVHEWRLSLIAVASLKRRLPNVRFTRF